MCLIKHKEIKKLERDFDGRLIILYLVSENNLKNKKTVVR